MEDNSVVAHGRRNGTIAPSFLVMCDAHTAVLFSPPRDGFSILDDLCKILI